MSAPTQRRGWRRRVTALVSAALLAPAATMVASGVQSAHADADRSAGKRGLVGPLSQINFLLGSWNCTLAVTPPGATTPVSNPVSLTVRPTLGGHWAQADALQFASESNPQRIESHQVFGWNPGQGNITTYYFDDTDGQGTGSSPGVQNGHFITTGTYFHNGFLHLGRDDIVSTGPRHFTVTISVAMPDAPDNFFVIGTQTCAKRG